MPTLSVVAGPNGCGKSTLTDRPHREIAILLGANRWTGERLPGWAAEALDSLSGS